MLKSHGFVPSENNHHCAFVLAQADLVSTCVVAETLSLLSPPVEPDAEAHQNDPTCPSDARDEGGLLHHVRDLLRDAVVPAHDHIPEVFTYMNTHKQREKRYLVN